jgi:hypothetical protein
MTNGSVGCRSAKHSCKQSKLLSSGRHRIMEGTQVATDTLEHANIETVLRRFSAAIERDQLRIDAMPLLKFHPSYDDAMWRDWRHGHRIYVNFLASTVADMPLLLLEKLSAIARSYKPEFIRGVILEIFSEVVSGFCDQDQYATAGQLFEGLIKQVQERAKATTRGERAKVSLARWFPLVDPLRIASDPECVYGPLASLTLLIAEIAPPTDI